MIVVGALAAVLVVALIVRGARSGARNLAEIDVYTVGRAVMEERLSGTGSFIPEESETVYSKISGTIETILVAEGDRVAESSLLGRVDREEYLTSMRLAEINLESTRLSAFQNLLAKVSSYKNALLNYEHAKRAAEKSRSLYAVDAVTEDELERSSETLETVELAYFSAREQLNLHLGNSPGAEPSIADEPTWDDVDASSDVERARLNLETAARALENCDLISPLAGTVTNVFPARGDPIGPNTKLFKIDVLARMKAEVLIDEVDIGKIVIGGTAEVTSDSILGDVISGEVSSVSPVVERVGNTRMSTVTVDLEQGDRRLLAGASCTARIVAVSRNDALVIPLTAYRNEGGSEYVFVVTDDEEIPGTALLEKREVTLGITTVNQVEVLSGLVEGEKIALGDVSYFRDEIRVRPSIDEDKE